MKRYGTGGFYSDGGTLFQVIELGANAELAIGSASARVAVPGAVIRVAATVPCRIRFGDASVVALASDPFFPEGVESFRVPPGATHLAAIRVGSDDGLATVTEIK